MPGNANPIANHPRRAPTVVRRDFARTTTPGITRRSSSIRTGTTTKRSSIAEGSEDRVRVESGIVQGSLPLRRKWLTLLEAAPRRARTYKTAEGVGVLPAG